MSLLEKLNHSAYQYYIANLPNFLQICQPLFDLGVKCFCYVKIFEDGSYLSFSNNKEFTKEYFFNVESQGNTFTSDIESTSLEQELNIIVQPPIRGPSLSSYFGYYFLSYYRL